MCLAQVACCTQYPMSRCTSLCPPPSPGNNPAPPSQRRFFSYQAPVDRAIATFGANSLNCKSDEFATYTRCFAVVILAKQGRMLMMSILSEWRHTQHAQCMIYLCTFASLSNTIVLWSQELAQWMQNKLDCHPLFERLSEAELSRDPAAGLLAEGTEEGQKVARNSGQVWRAVYRRITSS